MFQEQGIKLGKGRPCKAPADLAASSWEGAGGKLAGAERKAEALRSELEEAKTKAEALRLEYQEAEALRLEEAKKAEAL
eukprot:5898891-Amphidinium_carterae.1